MTRMRINIQAGAVAGLLLLIGGAARAQQFNSDNYLSKPAGVATIIVTFGQRNDMLMTTFSLVPNWEFTAAVYVFNNDKNPATLEGYSTSYYAKWMLYENKAKTGGVAVKGGTGLEPGLLPNNVGLEDAFKTYWMNTPITIPLFKNKVSWDLMPGVSYTLSSANQEEPGWAFTYSTRLAWYPWSSSLAMVGEVFGAVGQTGAIPEYKAGVRWEPNQYATFAITYGQEFQGGTDGAKFEIGMMLFTPPFFCARGCSTARHPD